MPVLGVIPARLGSSRLPQKPLLPLAGEPLILWVVRRVAQAGVCDRVVVATDARDVVRVVEGAGYEAVLTSPAHESGTARVSEVVALKAFKDFDLILNVQGDEPLVALEACAGALERASRGGGCGGCAVGELAPPWEAGVGPTAPQGGASSPTQPKPTVPQGGASSPTQPNPTPAPTEQEPLPKKTSTCEGSGVSPENSFPSC